MEEKLYELSMLQNQLVFGSRYIKAFEIYNIAIEFEIRDEIDLHFLMQAINLTALRNPNNQIRLIKKDKQTYQYFSNEAQEKIEYFEFNDEKTYQKYLNNFAKTVFPNKGIGCQLYKVNIIKKPNGNLAICGCFNHFIYDAYATIMFVNETLQIYKALKNNEALPKESISPIPAYEADKMYLNSKRYEIDKAYYEKMYDTLPHFTVLSGKKSRMYPKKGQIAKGAFFYQSNFKAEALVLPIKNDFRDKLSEYALSNKISAQSLYCFALKVYLTLVNETNDVCFEASVNRRSTIAQKKAGGTIASACRVRFNFDDNLSFKEGLTNVYTVVMESFKHPDYPNQDSSDDITKKFGISQLEAWSSILFTYQNSIKINEDIKYSFRRIPNGYEWVTLYMNIMPHNSENEYIVDYSYMPRIIEKEDILAYHKFMLNFLEEGMKNDNLTIKELIEKVGK